MTYADIYGVFVWKCIIDGFLYALGLGSGTCVRPPVTFCSLAWTRCTDWRDNDGLALLALEAFFFFPRARLSFIETDQLEFAFRWKWRKVCQVLLTVDTKARHLILYGTE